MYYITTWMCPSYWIWSTVCGCGCSPHDTTEVFPSDVTFVTGIIKIATLSSWFKVEYIECHVMCTIIIVVIRYGQPFLTYLNVVRASVVSTCMTFLQASVLLCN